MSDVSTLSPKIAEMQSTWALCSALMSGTEAMRKAGETYLPRWPAEHPDAYKLRLNTSTLHPVYSHTMQTLTGKPFSQPITFGDNVPARIKELCETDIDMQGRNLHAFMSDVMQETLSHGLSGVLVEYPPAQGVRTLDDERRLGLRPYFVHIHPWQLRGWKAQTIGGQTVFTQLRYSEMVEEEDGRFGAKMIEQIRVLEIGKWETYRKDEKSKEWVLHEEGTTTIDVIPFVPFYGDRKGFSDAKPPLLDVAYMNVEHFQSSSDQRTIEHVARVPVLTASGVDENTSIQVGASHAINLPVGAKMEYVEHTGAAIEAGRLSIERLEERMRQAGAELLVVTPGKVTATQAHIENNVGMCALQRITEAFEDAVDLCLQYMAEWLKLPEGGNVTLFKDFAAASMSDASADLLLRSYQAGLISKETYFTELQRRNLISDERTWGEEQELIDAQGPELGLVGGNGQ